MSKHFKLIWQHYNYCAFSLLPVTTAKRNPAGLWLTSEENALMTVVALCFSWDLCSVLHDWVWAGQSNHIPMDLWFVGFFLACFYFHQNFRYFLGQYPHLKFCKPSLRGIAIEEGVVGVWKHMVSWACQVFARHVHTNRWGNVCMVSEESLSLFNLSRGKMSPGWAKFRQKPAGRHSVLYTST